MNRAWDDNAMLAWLAAFAHMQAGTIEDNLPGRVASKDAAVLVAVLRQGADWQLLLTRRTPHLRSHAGQISFPGGRIEPQDVDAVAAALREAEEEVGLPARLVAVASCMPEYTTVTGYRITPVLGLVTAPFQPQPSPDEVDEVFHLPLTLALDERAYERHRYQRDGVEGCYYSLSYGDYFIWGATAAILRRMAQHHGQSAGC